MNDEQRNRIAGGPRSLGKERQDSERGESRQDRFMSMTNDGARMTNGMV